MTIGFQQLGSVMVDGAALAVLEMGEGPAVVLVHGSASDIRTWEAQIGPIAEHRRVVAYSRRYARPNAHIPEGADDPMDRHVADLSALMDALGIASAHLVGHSWGGFVALLAAIRQPGRYRSLTLMEPPVLPLLVGAPPRPARLLRLLATDPGAGFAVIRFIATAVAPAVRAYQRGDTEAAIRAFGCGVLGRRTFTALSPARLDQVRENNAADRAQLLGAGFPPLDPAEIRTLKLPALIVRGADSPKLMRLLAGRIHALLPGSELVDLPHASHIMHEDAPNAFNTALLGFLDRVEHS